MTVGDLKKILENVPDDYKVVRGPYVVGGVEIQPDSKRVSIA